MSGLDGSLADPTDWRKPQRDDVEQQHRAADTVDLAIATRRQASSTVDGGPAGASPGVGDAMNAAPVGRECPPLAELQ
jgi:hypothetical protein